VLSLPEANGDYICLLPFRGRGRLQESNVFSEKEKKTWQSENTDSWRRADGLPPTMIVLTGAARRRHVGRSPLERNVDGRVRLCVSQVTLYTSSSRWMLLKRAQRRHPFQLRYFSQPQIAAEHAGACCICEIFKNIYSLLIKIVTYWSALVAKWLQPCPLLWELCCCPPP